uniref:Uncharacterized protein n=1 Tax=Saccharum hybrid cultivar R570 TaxID=131158 RepID=A0A059PZ37_9POAL|nr:hypothetical protein SHCRBa_159_J23_R_460 [Saccharum hybrid cultivar R570]
MVMYLPPRSSSSGMRSIHRELQCRKSKPLAPTRSVAKKPTAPPRHGSSDAVQDPCPRPTHREVPSSTISHCRGSTITDASQQPRPRASSRCTPATPPPPRTGPSSAGSVCRASPGVPAHLKPGTVVRVRTRTATLKTGQVLVLWLKATIVSSSTNGSGYEVVYDANWPPGDPKGTVHVAPHHVKVINPSPSPTNPPQSLHPPAATSLRLIRSLFPEMELPARA